MENPGHFSVEINTQRVQRVILVTQAQQGQKVTPAIQDHRGQKDRKDQRAILVRQGHKGQQVAAAVQARLGISILQQRVR